MIVKARSSQFATVLQRQANITGGEARLFIQVIRQAYDDLVVPAKNNKPASVNREVVNFFFDGRMDLFADHIGIDPDYVREMLLKAIPGLKKFSPPVAEKLPQQPACVAARSHSASIGRMVGSNSGGRS